MKIRQVSWMGIAAFLASSLQGVAASWKAPESKLPPVVVSAIEELFEDGLPDPTGGDYREIEIALSKDWTINTCGWVLPSPGEQKQAIGWNGVIYPVKKVGERVNLRKQFAALSKDERIMGFHDTGITWPVSDDQSLRVNHGARIKVAFLLKLGEAELAEKAWNDGHDYIGGGERKIEDPFANMASVWLGNWFHRAVVAYLRRDFTEALSICRQLQPVKARVVATAAARGFAMPPRAITYCDPVMWELPLLAAESQRRAGEKPFVSVLDSNILTEGPERVTALIRDLEFVSVQLWIIPGTVDVREDPVVQLLIKEGDGAVEPLLTCLAEDNRLTLSRSTNQNGALIPVYEAAYAVLGTILNASIPLMSDTGGGYYEQRDIRGLGPEERRAGAEKLRTAWLKKADGRAADAYTVLKDDKAGVKDWFRAVDNIVQPTDGTFTSYYLAPLENSSYQIYVGPVPFPTRGESLRNKSNPSVADMLVMRAKQIIKTEKNGSAYTREAAKLIKALAAWDGRGHLEDLRDLQKWFDAEFPLFTDERTDLYQRRLELGDPSALKDYTDWMMSLTPDTARSYWQSSGSMGAFAIMWHYPNDPAMQRVAEKLFGGKDSLMPLLCSGLVPTPMIGMAAFRKGIDRSLADTSPAGTGTEDTHNIISYKCSHDGRTWSEHTKPAEGAPPVPIEGTSFSFRLCDYYASLLAKVEGFPSFELYWPEAKRDETIALCRSYLRQYGDAYQMGPKDAYATDYSLEANTPRFFLPQLERPATAEDVKQGRALFTLSGKTRIWPAPEWPLNGKETSNEAWRVYPDPSRRPWQVEEVWNNGKWERYFGIVEGGVAKKIAASDINLRDPRPRGGDATKALSGQIVGPGDQFPKFTFSLLECPRTKSDAPLPVTVMLRNRSGLDQTVPSSLLLPEGANRALPEGISFSVSYSEILPPRVQRISELGGPVGDRKFQELPLRKDVTIAKRETAGPTLYPTESTTAMSVNLRDYYDMSRPGTYIVVARFHVPGEKTDSSNQMTYWMDAPAEN